WVCGDGLPAQHHLRLQLREGLPGVQTGQQRHAGADMQDRLPGHYLSSAVEQEPVGERLFKQQRRAPRWSALFVSLPLTPYLLCRAVTMVLMPPRTPKSPVTVIS